MVLPVHDRTVFRLIESREATSQIEIAKALHLRTNTVHGVIQKLLENGKIKNERSEIYGRGRPIQHYRVAQPTYILSIMFVGSDIYLAVVHDQKVKGDVLERHAAQQLTREQAFTELRRDFKEVLELAGIDRDKLHGVVFAHGGSEISKRRYMSSISPWMQNVSQKDFERLFKLPVKLLNEAALLAKMELRARVRDGCRTLIVFNLGDGLSSVGINYTGAWDHANIYRGEMGHVVIEPNGPVCGCGNRGCLEALISGPALQNRVRQDLRDDGNAEARALSVSTGFETFFKLDRLAQAGGNSYATALLNEFLDRCAWVISLIVNLHNPDVIVMNGYAFLSREHWIEEIRRRSRPYILNGETASIKLEFPRTDTADYLCAIALHYDNETKNGSHSSSP